MKTTPPGIEARAFTLVELLTTLLITSILFALILPQFQRLGEQSRMTGCLNNLRQLGQGIILFTADHQGRLPPSEEGGSDDTLWPGPIFGKTVSKAAPTWAEYVAKTYFDHQFDALACPSLPKKRSYQVRGNRPDYGYNQRLSPINTTTGYREGLRLNSISNPSEIILLGESGFPSGQNRTTGFFRLRDAADLSPNHHAKVNVLYLDLHAATHPLNFAHPPAADAPLGRNQFVP